MHKLEQLPPTPVEILKRAYQIASEEGLKYVYTGNAPGSEISDTKCPSCNSTLVVRQGYRIETNNITGGKCNKCGTTLLKEYGIENIDYDFYIMKQSEAKTRIRYSPKGN